MPDKYDYEIEDIVGDDPDERIFRSRIKDHWSMATPLFNGAGFKHGDIVDWSGKVCGCLTQIRYGGCYCAETPELTAAIKADERIPNDFKGITREHLPLFAEWQRRIDKELNRTV